MKYIQTALSYIHHALPYVALFGIGALYKLGLITGTEALALLAALGLPSPVSHAFGALKRFSDRSDTESS